MFKRRARWFGSLPLTIVATNSLMLALVLSYTWSMHWAFVLAIIPIVAWLVAHKWLSRDR